MRVLIVSPFPKINIWYAFTQTCSKNFIDIADISINFHRQLKRLVIYYHISLTDHIFFTKYTDFVSLLPQIITSRLFSIKRRVCNIKSQTLLIVCISLHSYTCHMPADVFSANLPNPFYLRWQHIHPSLRRFLHS